MPKINSKWKFAVDKGGTFTDVIGLDPYGNYHTLKLLSNSQKYKDPSVEGIRKILGLKDKQPLSKEKIEATRFGTTATTNALLERKGGKVTLLITKGFSDLLEIGFQSRPEIFNLCIKKPATIYSSIIEVDERINQAGEIIKKINLQKLKESIKKITLSGPDAIAIVFMHAWKNPDHELACEKVLKNHAFSNIFLSHKTMNLIKIVNRGQSTLVDAYLSPIIGSYIKEIQSDTKGIPIEFIQSSGGLSNPDLFRGKEAILSGPAGGAIAVSKIVEEKKLKSAIGFDMGGTSTDVSKYEGKHEKVYEKEIGGITLLSEMLNIVTVASGGGSVLWFDGQKMRVGPESAGAYPDPACYGFGRPLTITDANLLTGRIMPEYFPKTFGPDQNSPLNGDIIQEKFFSLTKDVNTSSREKFTPQEVALGFLRIANEKMAMAIKEISVSKGFDVRDYALVCFGGAGGQHACQVASILEIETIIFHPLSGVMSAYGIGLSIPMRKSALSILTDYNKETHKQLSTSFKKMEEGFFNGKKIKEDLFLINREIDLRPKGADTFLTVKYMGFEETLDSFKKQYRQCFAFYTENKPIEAVNLRMEVQETGSFFSSYSPIINNKQNDAHGKPDPVLLEVFNNLFMGIATEMGLILKNTSHSVNIKERLDFSCAIFDGKGDLVSNAPHQPVHLGSMADTVKAVIKNHTGDIKPGDIYLTSNPYDGGSHLPDLTVVCPVFSEKGEIIFFTASRGHHADIGGITPGSMPPTAKHIDDEGILINGVLLVRNGLLKERELRHLLLGHKNPARNMGVNKGDSVIIKTPGGAGMG